MKLKEDEPAPAGQQMDVTPSDHSENQIATANSKPNMIKSRPSIASQLAAIRLVKKARFSLINKSRISSHPAAIKPTNNNITVPEVNSEDLSKETIDSIFESSCSLLNFATRLMAQLFDQSELLKSRNVYGLSGPHPHQIQNLEEALDERRVNIIRRLVEERAKPGDYTWKQCVRAMNNKIGKIRAELLPEKR